MNNLTEFEPILIDEFEIISNNSTCDENNKINISDHYLYLILNILIVIAFSLPTSKIYLIYLHFILTIAYLLQCLWSYQYICGFSNLFTWSVAFFILNSFNTIKLLIQKKEVTFSINLLNEAFSTIFEPMAMSRDQIKKLFSPELAKIICLEKGEPYALENTTKTDKLSLLLSGRMIVTYNDSLLHTIEPITFIDAFEFSSKTADEKFRVTILADASCKVLCWSKKSNLQYFLNKESTLSQIFTTILSNDIANKLYLMNEKIQIEKGNYLDIRKTLHLPSLSASFGKIFHDKDQDSNRSFLTMKTPIKLRTDKQ